MKAAAKADVAKLRASATAMKAAQRKGDNSLVWEHQKNKREARARHLVYGFVRGHEWSRMENIEKSRPINKWYLQAAWKAAQENAKAHYADFAYTNDLLAKYV